MNWLHVEITDSVNRGTNKKPRSYLKFSGLDGVPKSVRVEPGTVFKDCSGVSFRVLSAEDGWHRVRALDSPRRLPGKGPYEIVPQ
jgi:hypothetical protein